MAHCHALLLLLSEALLLLSGALQKVLPENISLHTAGIRQELARVLCTTLSLEAVPRWRHGAPRSPAIALESSGVRFCRNTA